MAIKVNTGLSPFWYTPEGEKDEESPAKFKIKPIDQMTYLDIESEMKMRGDQVTLTKRSIEICLRAGLSDWEGIEDQNGKPLKFSPHNFKYLDAELLTELAGEIIISSRLDEDARKN